jgi:SpoVK/Ycf46/Vps4 family AAA+-type ATPase
LNVFSRSDWFVVRFSQRSGGKSGEINPLILLHGLPGTGKTSLCQGLAQKISIRLNSVYKETKLIEIKTATLLSRYYSESAKQVDEIFTAIERMCRENNERFICVLIDEVESIANSRDLSAKHGEAQDSVRVTNALLTGLDRTKACPNLIFLCTSNMFDCLDAAFLDRCGLRLAINPPSAASRYAIVRGRVQKLINRRIISSELTLPSHRDAVIDMDNKELPGSKLLYIVELINSVNSQMTPEGGISGRRLAQLPEQALLLHLRGEDCGLELALSFIEKFVLDEQSRNKRLKTDSQMRDTNVGEEEAFEGIEVRGQKRKLKIILEEDCDMEELQAIIKLITTVPSQTQKRKRIVRIEKEDEKA